MNQLLFNYLFIMNMKFDLSLSLLRPLSSIPAHRDLRLHAILLDEACLHLDGGLTAHSSTVLSLTKHTLTEGPSLHWWGEVVGAGGNEEVIKRHTSYNNIGKKKVTTGRK